MGQATAAVPHVAVAACGSVACGSLIVADCRMGVIGSSLNASRLMHGWGPVHGWFRLLGSWWSAPADQSAGHLQRAAWIY